MNDNNLVVDPKNLSELTKHIIQGLLMRNSQCHLRLFAKIDVQIVEETPFFSLQITKCGPGHPNWRFLINDTFAEMRNVEGQTFQQKKILAIIISKALKNPTKLDVKKVFLGCNSNFAIITNCSDDYKDLLWIELNSLKQFTLIKLNFQVSMNHYVQLIDFLKQDMIKLQSIDPNVKFILRRGTVHIYRNRVKMDGVILACQIFSSSLRSIFEHSVNRRFRKDIARILKTKNSRNIENVVGSVLLAQANKNYVNVFDNYYNGSNQDVLDKENTS